MAQKRIDKILELVNAAGELEVNQLATQLKVSQVTIRKDLSTLEEKGLLRRHHGIATINDPNNLNFRLAQNYEIKRQIAEAGADQIHNQATIMIESGSTCALLAEALGKQGKHVTIITISSFIADFVSKYPNIQVILLGGYYQASAQVVVGPLAKQMVQRFKIKQLFVGTDGFAANRGFYGNDLMRTEVVQTMAEQAQELTILTDSSKFLQESLTQQLKLNQVSQVITDDQIPATALSSLKAAKINVQLVKN